MMLDVQMEKNLVSAGRTVDYKYAILHGGESKKPIEYEFVPKKPRGYNQEIVNRELKIPSDQLYRCTGNE